MKHGSGSQSCLDNILVSFCFAFLCLFLLCSCLKALTVGLQSLQPPYVTGRRKIDVLLCSLYVQHQRGNIFVSLSLSLSLHSRAHWYNNILSWRIPPIRSLWKLLSQSPGLIKCIFLNPFFCIGDINRDTLYIYSPSSEHRKYYSVTMHRIQLYQL